MPTGRMQMVQFSFFVGLSSIYRCTAFEESTTLLMSIMAMASHDCQGFSLLSCCLCVVKGF
jgi:hypothetical protein